MKIQKGRLSRLKSLGGLAASLTGNAITSLGDRIVSGREAAALALHQKVAQKLVETLGDMRGLPMKVGQILSFMDGAFPPEYQDIYRRALGVLQAQGRPYSWDDMATTFLEEYGVPPETFQSFNRTPIASASIGQVYRGKLPDGRDVAIKVQYPEISQAIDSDLKNVEALVKTFRMVLPSLDNEQMFHDLLSRFREEIDYTIEAKNQRDFARHWRGNKSVVIPEPVLELCRRRVLVTDFHEGQSFSQMLSSTDTKTKSAYGESLFGFTYRSILAYGLFNADPHPGNYLFRSDGKVIFLDFGSVQRYDGASRAAFKKLLNGILEGQRGNELWRLLEETLLIEPGTSAVVQNALIDYLLFVMTPLLAKQPFRFTTEFTASVSALSTKIKIDLAKQILNVKWQEPKREGLSPLVRILFGLNSVLAALEAESDWKRIIETIQDD